MGDSYRMESRNYENHGIYRTITREDDNPSSLHSDFPKPPNGATLRRRLRLRRRRMERQAVSELPSPAISIRVLTVTASTGHPQLCGLLRGGHMERHSRFRELLRHRGKPPPSLAHLGRSSSPWCSAVDCFVQSWVSSCGDRRGHHRTEPPPAQPCHGCTSAHLCGPVVSWNPMARALSAISPDIGLPSSRYALLR